MNINRNNYEEYFILYMDNELGNDDRRQVEDFIQKHPDLKEELELLLQYKMAPDTTIVFPEKKELIMSQSKSGITLENYEEWLVLYMDNELTAEQKITVDQFVTNHPSIKSELTLLQKTQLQPDKIIFTDKELLYRRTADRPVVIMRWWKVAAAAMLVLAISITAIIMLNKKSPADKDIVTVPKIEQKTDKETPAANNNEVEKKNEQSVIANAVHPAESQILNQTNSNVVVKHTNTIIKKLPENLPIVKKEEPIIVNNNQQPSNNLPKPMNNPNVNTATNNVIASNNLPKEIIKPNQSIADPVTINTNQPSQVVYNSSARDNELNQSGGKKSKLRGFLRKVVRTFEKTTNIDPANDDDRILVGGLAFKLN